MARRDLLGSFQLHAKLKDDINKQTAHAHVVNSEHNFDFVPGERAEIITSYFDFEDDQLVKLDLWVAAKAGLHAVDLILTVQAAIPPQTHRERSRGGLADKCAGLSSCGLDWRLGHEDNTTRCAA